MHELAAEQEAVGDHRKAMRLGRAGHALIEQGGRTPDVHAATLAREVSDTVSSLP